LFTNITNLITQLITQLYIATGLLGIVFAMALESCCLPVPSEVVMPVAGVMVATRQPLLGTMPGWPLWLDLGFIALAGAGGCLIGSIVAYSIGSHGGRALLLKYGRYVLISEHDAERADAFFQRWGNAAAFFSRLLPIVRTYISLPAGIAGSPFRSFCVYTFLGSFPWCLILAALGALLGKSFGTVNAVLHWLNIVVLGIAAISIITYIWQRVRKPREARGEE
jgi:membrane protein DedA with SNARE-associated domain